MTIGVGLLLTALGAILTFAVNASLGGVDLTAIGVILMIVGVAGIVLELVLFAPRRRGVPSRSVVADGPVEEVRYHRSAL